MSLLVRLTHWYHRSCNCGKEERGSAILNWDSFSHLFVCWEQRFQGVDSAFRFFSSSSIKRIKF